MGRSRVAKKKPLFKGFFYKKSRKGAGPVVYRAKMSVLVADEAGPNPVGPILCRSIYLFGLLNPGYSSEIIPPAEVSLAEEGFV